MKGDLGGGGVTGVGWWREVNAVSFDWNHAAETSIETALQMVPYVGGLLGALVDIFWPQSEENVWAEIEQDVERLINQKISQLVSEQVQNSLAGLKNNLADYLTAVNDQDPKTIPDRWITADGDFDQQLPSFQTQGYELLLLPLFAQFANLNLSLLRDGVLNGASWGWNDKTQQSNLAKLQQKITDYTTYAQKIYQQGHDNLAKSTKANYHECEPFRTLNAFQRQMTTGILDFLQLWPYFDPSKYPKPVSIYLDREIYSDPVGTADDSGPINLPTRPTQPISQITVWAWDRIDAVQLTYPSGGGPGGVTTTPRMGDIGGSNQPPYGGVFNVSSNPVVVAAGLADDICNAFSFTFKDGTSSGTLGGNDAGGLSFSFSYAGEILSSIHINGVSSFYGSADCAVFGFKYEKTKSASVEALRRLYIASPKGATVQQLAQRCAAKPASVDELQEAAAAGGWDRQREAFDKYIRSLADRKALA